MPDQRLRMVTSRSGLSAVEVDGLPDHSPYDPRREAEKFATTFQVQKADVVMVFGWGLGYLADSLLPRLKPSARVVVFEPDSELFKLSRRPNDHRFRFVTGPELCQFFDNWMLEGCQETDEFLWMIWPAAARLHGSVVDLLTTNFKTRLRDRAANLLTHFNNGAKYFQNALANFEYQTSADAGSLFERFKNVPLVLVSAGPSLDRNIHELRGMENRCFLLSVDTALRPLLAAGITPHAVISADPSELNARHITGVIPESTWLVAEQAVQSSVLQSAARRMLFSVRVFPDPLLAKFGMAKSTLQVWGSVATAALDLAWRMGANPIIFAGQDFAYSWDREYARNTIFHNLFDAALWSDSGNGYLGQSGPHDRKSRRVPRLLCTKDQTDSPRAIHQCHGRRHSYRRSRDSFLEGSVGADLQACLTSPTGRGRRAVGAPGEGRSRAPS
jgi:hypothetical protein